MRTHTHPDFSADGPGLRPRSCQLRETPPTNTLSIFPDLNLTLLQLKYTANLLRIKYYFVFQLYRYNAVTGCLQVAFYCTATPLFSTVCPPSVFLLCWSELVFSTSASDQFACNCHFILEVALVNCSQTLSSPSCFPSFFMPLSSASLPSFCLYISV